MLPRAQVQDKEEEPRGGGETSNGKRRATNRDASLSMAKLQSLRRAIDSKLHEHEVYQRIHQLIIQQSHRVDRNQSISKAEQSQKQPMQQEEEEEQLEAKATDHQEQAEIQQKAINGDEAAIVKSILESDLMKSLMSAVKEELRKPEEVSAPRHQLEQGEIGVDSTDEAEDVADQPHRSFRQHQVVLHVRVVAGKAFVDQLMPVADANVDVDLTMNDTDHHPDTSDTNQTQESIKPEFQVGDVESFFRLVAFFQHHRLVSKDVVCNIDPLFEQDWAFPIDCARATRTEFFTRHGVPCQVEVLSPWEALCSIQEPIRLVLLKVTKRVMAIQGIDSTPKWRELRREWIASHCVEWRRVLCSASAPNLPPAVVHVPVQLVGRMKAPIGTLDLRVELLNFPRSTSVCKQISSYLHKESLQVNALNHSFYDYAQQWWEEYRSQVHESCSSHILSRSAQEQLESLFEARSKRATVRRFVKLFAEDEEGKFRFVCKFVTPLQDPKAIRGPSEAARFVSLMPFEANQLAGGVKDETWRSLACFLAIGKGDCQDHAVLLASLLLGCGLDAYVCIGTISSSAFAATTSPRSRRGASPRSSPRPRDREVGHIWVLTRGIDTTEVTFWEPLTGERFALQSRRYGYRSIDCVFNGSSFFANCQPRQQHLSTGSFAFEDDTFWKSMNKSMIARLPAVSRSLTLIPPDLMSQQPQETFWLVELKKAIANERKRLGFVTKWSRQLGFLLLPALNSYEMERLYGVAQLENEFFQQSIKRFVAEGSTFQGFPSMFTLETPQDALQILMNQDVASQILAVHAPQAQHGIAVRCFAYPESICVVWVMFAVVFPSEKAS